MKKNIQEQINDQINFEFYSSYVYLSMSSCFKTMNLNGFAHWMELQAQEEMFHAMKLYNFLHDRGGHIELEQINKPQAMWENPVDIFKTAYEHEVIVTGRINDLVELALQEKDHATNAHLQWFISEQVEEESNFSDLYHQVKLAAEVPNGYFMLDRELGQRVLNLPPEGK